MDLTALSAREQAELVRGKKVSASELLDAVLEHVHSVDGRCGSPDNPPEELPEDADKIHAFVTFCESRAREKAAEVDRKIAS